jgi:arsenate reductase-like glutaredoxin family protein
MGNKTNKYRLYFESPNATFGAEADDLKSLCEATSLGLSKSIEAESKILSDSNFEDAVTRAFILYKTSSSSRRKVTTSLTKKGVEFDVIRCFLRGRTIEEAATLIKEGKNVKICISSIGRVYLKLRKVGLVPGLFSESKTVSKKDEKNSKLL